jgi:hypothetical protein
MKKKVIEFLKSHGFKTVSHNSSTRQIFQNKNLTVTIQEQENRKFDLKDNL